jgi:energy-coupling factor transporter ATP-binding protein EcfA2
MTLEQEIVNWLLSRPNWQQEAIARTLSKKNLEASDLSEIAQLCKSEGTIPSPRRDFSGIGAGSQQDNALRLESISNIVGIDNLKPRNALTFGKGNLTVVFGGNGAGKSGYVRIIKKLCGKGTSDKLRPNVFEAPPSKQGCSVSYSLGDQSHSVDWEVDKGAIRDLTLVDIFDTESGAFYLNKENQVSYAPRVLRLFDYLVQVCEQVKSIFQTQKDNLPPRLPKLPPEHLNTKAGQLFTNLKPEHTAQDLELITSWREQDDTAFKQIDERLKTKDPKQLATSKRNKKKQLDEILRKVNQCIVGLDSNSCVTIIAKRVESAEKRKIATDGAKQVLNNTKIEGVGGETWRALWEAARQYSEQSAYQNQAFPLTDVDARCVLCQQPLDADGRQRFTHFEAFVKGELERAAKKVEADYAALIAALPVVPTEESLSTACHAAGIGDDQWIEQLRLFWKSCCDLIAKLKNPDVKACEGIKAELYPWVQELETRSDSLEAEAKQHDADAKTFDTTKVEKELNELKAKKWTTQQATAINEEAARLKTIKELDRCIKSTRHTDISIKAGKVSAVAITDAYIKRFNEELEKLGAKRIRVELVKTRTENGKALHAVQLKGLSNQASKPIEILSEGEGRIVSIAAFLADVTGRAVKSTFVFDDPISSLDQEYEEKTVERLIELSQDRQVIIFTHRLSLASIIESKIKELDLICIEHERWGAGEPNKNAIKGKNTAGILNRLKNESLSKATRALLEEGYASYYPLALAICVDLRKTIERIVELVFLNDVIQRHRRDITTKGKIGGLAKIQLSDCTLMERHMGKYSVYMHSHSSESQVDVPEPEEITKDIDELLTWVKEFAARPIPTNSESSEVAVTTE